MGTTLLEYQVGDEESFLLATVPATLAQRRLALAVVAALLVAFVTTLTIGAIPALAAKQMRLNAFVPTLTAILVVNDTITSILLFAQYSIIRSRALLVLASGYLFTALMVISYALSFPGAFSPTGLFGDGVQTTAWVYSLWHYGFPAAVILYAWLRDAGGNKPSYASPRSAIGWSVAITVGVVCGLTWLASVRNGLLPDLFLDSTNLAPIARYVVLLSVFEGAFALAGLWSHRRSLLDQWLMVVMCAWIAEQAITGVLLASRFSIAFYVIRLYSLTTSIVVLTVLLAEMSRLYARQARSHLVLQHERNNKLMNMEAMASSIAHEVRQPLTGIAASGGAALRFLERSPPNIEQAQFALNTVIAASLRAGQVFDNIRALFGSADQRQEPIDVNEMLLEALRTLHGELTFHGITANPELTSELPLAMGHGGQLQGVILNLVRNAIEAMAAINDGRRVLRLSTKLSGHNITIAIEDTGPGIDPEKLRGIFDPFVTTKPNGMGLGLAICRMIIDRHGGTLSARSSEKGSGALFQFVLPINSAAPSKGTTTSDNVAELR